MKIVLILVLMLMLVVCWIFGTSVVVNGGNNKTAFIIKSIFYWVGVALSFCVGFYLNK